MVKIFIYGSDDVSLVKISMRPRFGRDSEGGLMNSGRLIRLL